MEIKTNLSNKSTINNDEITNLTLCWDGTFIPYPAALKRETKGKLTYGTFSFIKDKIEYSIYCGYRRVKNFIGSILDETKSLFGINKRGTHTIKVKKSLYLLFRVTLLNRENDIYEPVEDIGLCFLDKDLLSLLSKEKETEKSFLFRAFFGIRTMKKDITYHPINNIILTSPEVTVYPDKTFLTKSVVKEYNLNPDFHLLFKDKEALELFFERFRKIVMRVGKDDIWLINCYEKKFYDLI